MLDTTLTPTIADIAAGGNGSTTHAAEREVRNRSQSHAIARSRAFSTVSDPDQAGASSYPGDCRGDSAIALSTALPTPTSSFQSPSSNVVTPPNSPPPSASHGSLMRLLSGHEGPVEDPATAIAVETNRQSMPIRTMLCVVTGSAMCASIFSLALRFADRRSIQITVQITSDWRDYPNSLLDSLESFRQAASSISNITLVFMSTPSSDIDGILERCTEKIFDLIVFGFSEQGCDGGERREEAPSLPVPLSRSHRSASMSFGFDAVPLDAAGEGSICWLLSFFPPSATFFSSFCCRTYVLYFLSTTSCSPS